GYLGRLRVKKTAQSKNLFMLLEAAKIVCNEVPESRLVLAGAGFDELKPLVRKIGLDESVIYVGDIPYEENAKFLKMCDVVVCPAVSDGFCFLTAQASACGIPVVASNAGSHRERVVDGNTGIVAELTAEDISDSILRILSDSALAARLGKNGADYSKELTWERSALKHLELYERLKAAF
ncbi:MAG: glycosyltransferase family 4 protein, partial [Thaumarchaeota archaeon]|nr:glycosyltransferase family 4 protein [Nitrososphaerota archaeon]